MRLNNDVEIEFDTICWRCSGGNAFKRDDNDENGKCRFCLGVGRITTTEGDELIDFLVRQGFKREQ